ncbi:uncharacterized protein [Physeter macrocephalus]|uniref:Uncharacterized protein n=1 Tax=Physeter macrocephalus TaxID=9755 RepID=A0A455BA96_PHYMC|nr:uncharacterized protein LOC114486211 [Physeter catodon]|eukprot:XP_028344883.1 uncharacterized protein LOC114486211 [Physeter catodon]
MEYVKETKEGHSPGEIYVEVRSEGRKRDNTRHTHEEREAHGIINAPGTHISRDRLQRRQTRPERRWSVHSRDLSYIFSSKSLQFWVWQDPRENRDKHRCLHKPARQLEDPTRVEREAFGNLRVLLCSVRKSSRDTFLSTLQGTSPGHHPTCWTASHLPKFCGCRLFKRRAARMRPGCGPGEPGFCAQSGLVWVGRCRSRRVLHLYAEPRGPERGPRLRSCKAGARVSSSSRSGRG